MVLGIVACTLQHVSHMLFVQGCTEREKEGEVRRAQELQQKHEAAIEHLSTKVDRLTTDLDGRKNSGLTLWSTVTTLERQAYDLREQAAVRASAQRHRNGSRGST